MPKLFPTLLRSAIPQAFSLIGSAAVFYVTHPVLLLISLIPASLRAYQMQSGNAPQVLEIIVAMARVFIAVWAIYAAGGKPGPLFSADTWNLIWKTILPRTAAMSGEDWLRAAAAYAIAMALLWIAGWALERLAAPGALPVIFFIRNMTIIPLTILFILRLIRWI